MDRKGTCRSAHSVLLFFSWISGWPHAGFPSHNDRPARMPKKPFNHFLKICSLAWFALGIAQAHGADIPAPISCLLYPNTVTEVASPVQGVVQSILVDRGQSVQAGQLLLQLNDSVEQAVVRQAEAEASLLSSKVARNRQLIQDNLIAPHQREEMETGARIAGAKLDEARSRLAQRSVRSPVNGIVLERMVDVGERVGEAPLLRIVSLNPLYAELVFPQNAHGHLRPQQSVRLLLPALGRTVVGRIMVVDPVIDAASNSFGVRVSIVNEGNTVPSGLRCEVLGKQR